MINEAKGPDLPPPPRPSGKYQILSQCKVTKIRLRTMHHPSTPPPPAKNSGHALDDLVRIVGADS